MTKSCQSPPHTPHQHLLVPPPSLSPPFMLGNSCSSHLPWGQGQRCVECRSRGGRQVSLTLPSLHQRCQEGVDCYGSKQAVSSVMEPDKAEDSLAACPRAHNQLLKGHLEFLTSSPGLFLSSTRSQDGIPESPERPFRDPGIPSLGTVSKPLSCHTSGEQQQY